MWLATSSGAFVSKKYTEMNILSSFTLPISWERRTSKELSHHKLIKRDNYKSKYEKGA